jgi:predicted PurR-regulated permease PerM
MSNSLAQVQKRAYSLVIFVLVILILKAGSVIIIPLVWGAFFSFALYPISNWLEEKRFPRGFAIALTLILVATLVITVLYFLTDQVLGLIADIPEIKSAFETKTNKYLGELRNYFGLGTHGLPSTTDILKQQNVESAIFETGRSLVLLGVIPLFIFLMLYYKDFYAEFLKRKSKDGNPAILNWIKESGSVIQSYLLGMLLVTGIVSLISGFAFYFLGIKYFMLFAVFIAVMNLIPYVGVIFSSLLVVLYVLLTTDTIFYPLTTLILLWLIQLIENNLITPFVVGAKVRVNAFAVILAILIGAYIWGVSGMILFIPIVGILKITFERIPALAPYGFLLGDNNLVNEKRENFWKMLVRKVKNKKEAERPL